MRCVLSGLYDPEKQDDVMPLYWKLFPSDIDPDGCVLKLVTSSGSSVASVLRIENGIVKRGYLTDSFAEVCGFVLNDSHQIAVE